MQPIVLVTGGSRGIGAATALLAAQAGYAVAVNYRANSLAADEVVRQIRAINGTAITVQADVAVESEVLAMFAKVDAKFGPISALVNSAGIVDVGSRVDTSCDDAAVDFSYRSQCFRGVTGDNLDDFGQRAFLVAGIDAFR